MARDAIGEHEFTVLHGEPEGPQERVFVLARPGVEGVGFLRAGLAGQPFTLESGVDLADWTDVETTYRQYVATVGGDPVGLVRGGIDYAAFGWQVEVLRVEKIAGQTRALLGSVGGQNPPARAWLACRWTLIAVIQE